MVEQLVSFDSAKLATDLGFKQWSTLKYPYWVQIDFGNDHKIKKLIRDSLAKEGFQYDNEIVNPIYYEAPTQALLQRWLREVYNFHIIIQPDWTMHKIAFCYKVESDNYDSEYLSERQPSYEQALELGLQEALKMVILQSNPA